MKYKLKEDDKGQAALFDAVIFLVIMIIAASLVSVFTSQYSKEMDLNARDDMMDYTQKTCNVVLGATLNSTYYEDVTGERIEKPPGDTKVMNLILEELYQLNFGISKESFVLGFNHDIKILIRNLVRTDYHFALQGTFSNGSTNKDYLVFISDIVPDYKTKEEFRKDKNDYSQQVPRSNLAAVTHTQPMIGIQGEAEISFLLWR
jgi:hypothetical protein